MTETTLKIEIYDLVAPINHLNLYKAIVSSLSSFSHLVIYTRQGYFQNEFQGNKNIEIRILEENKQSNNRLIRLFRNVKQIYRIKNIFNTQKNSKIILTFDTSSFAFSLLLLKLRNTYIMHHKNIDELSSIIKRVCFKMYMNKVKHIVFEDLFSEKLLSVGVKKDNLLLVPHPISNQSSIILSHKYELVGLSNSNDEIFIENLILFESKNSFFRNKKMKVVIRSKNKEYDNGYLKVFKGQLSIDVYNEFIGLSKSILLPLPKNFIYRVSGTMFDAFSRGKYVFSNANTLTEYYENKYPGIISTFDSIEEFYRKIDMDFSTNTLSFERFVSDHSLVKINECFRNEFGEKNEHKKK